MSSTSSKYLSIDEGHYYNSESLILKEAFEDPPDKSLSQIKLSSGDVRLNCQQDNSLNLQLENLIGLQAFQPQPSQHELKRALLQLEGYQGCLKDKMQAVARLVEEGNKRQAQIKQLICSLRDNLESSCDVEEHAKYQGQLAKNRELIVQSQRQMEALLECVKSNDKRLLEQSDDDRRNVTPVKWASVTEDCLITNKSENKLTKLIGKTSIEFAQTDLQFTEVPIIKVFKRSAMEESFVLYEDQKVKVTNERTDQGIVLTMESEEPSAVLRMGESVGKSLTLSWDWLVQSKKHFEECEIEVPTKQELEKYEISVPLPLNYLFQKRLKGIVISKVKQLLSCHTLVIKHYDRDIWPRICSGPECLGLDSVDDDLVGAFSIKGATSLYLVRIPRHPSSQELRVEIFYKSTAHLQQLVDFYKHLLCH